MPAFIFISGYFSKRIPSLKKNALWTGHSLFCIRDSLLSFIHLYTGQRDRLLFYKAEIFPLVSDGTVRWRLLSPLIEKIPGAWFFQSLPDFLLDSLILEIFFPFRVFCFSSRSFLPGKKFDSSSLARFRNRKGYLCALTILGSFAVFLFTDKYHHRLDQKIFYGRYSYADMDMSSVEGVLVRIGCYLISFLLIYLFMLVLPTEKKSYSYLGERTMAIYIFHGFVYSCLKYGSSILTSVESNLECLYLLTFCFFLVWFLSRKPFVLFTNKIAHLF